MKSDKNTAKKKISKSVLSTVYDLPVIMYYSNPSTLSPSKLTITLPVLRHPQPSKGYKPRRQKSYHVGNPTQRIRQSPRDEIKAPIPTASDIHQDIQHAHHHEGASGRQTRPQPAAQPRDISFLRKATTSVRRARKTRTVRSEPPYFQPVTS